MTLGVFAQRKPSPLPGFFSGLPSPMRNAVEWIAEKIHTLSAKLSLRMRVEAPPFVRITQKEVQVRGSQGSVAVVSIELKTDKPGDWRGNLVVRLTGGPYGATNVIVPLSAKVLGTSTSSPRAVLITASPYAEYSTGNGRDFEPVAALCSRLSEQGLRVDFCRTFPDSLSLYRSILLADSEMAGLGSAQTLQLRSFVAGGGRIILAANAFFVPTVPSANRFLRSFGLQIVDQDAGLNITNSRVVSDVLTFGIKHVDFFRPSLINVTDPLQGKLLVESGDGEGGYVAVSRQPSRGEVIVVTQSLWWNWIHSDPAKADNSLLLENLLAH